MQGFAIRAAKALNKAIGRKGSVFVSNPIDLPPTSATDPPVAPAETSSLKSRWRYIGLIDPDEMPAAGRAA